MIFDIFKPRNAITESSELRQLLLQGAQTDSGVNVNSDSALRVAAVYSAVSVISQTLAQIPLILYKRDGERRERALSNNLYYLLHDAPNSFQTSYSWRQTNQAFLLLRGNAYSFISKSADGRVLELLPMHPDKVDIKQGKDHSLSYLFTDSDGEKIPLKQNQVFRLTGLSFDGVKGISPISYARQTIGISIAADKHSALSFKNGGKFNGILKHPGTFKNNEIAKRVSDSWDAAFSGDSSFKTPLLEDNMDWMPVSMSNKDAQYIETRKFQITDIARIFRIPPHMIGDLDRATFSNIEQQSIEFVNYTMMPWFKSWEQSISLDILGRAKSRSMFAKFKEDGLLRGDIASRNAALEIELRNGVISVNEWRKIKDMNPVDGGDERVNTMQQTGGSNATQSA